MQVPVFARDCRPCYYLSVGFRTGAFLWRDLNLAKSRSSLKRARQSKEREARNLHVKSTTRGAIRRVRSACAAGDLEEARRQLDEASRLLDRAAAKGVLHRNAAARRKSRLAKLVGGLAGKEPAESPA